MTLPTEPGERRKDKRYGLPKAIVSMPQPSVLVIGTVVDISESGLAVRYPDRGEHLVSAFEIDILLTENNVFMTGFPVVTIFDCTLENLAPVSLASQKRCGLKFGKLSSGQTAQLKQVLQTFTDPLEPLRSAR